MSPEVIEPAKRPLARQTPPNARGATQRPAHATMDAPRQERLRSEELLRSMAPPPATADIWREPEEDIPIVAVRVGEQGPDNLTSPGVRCYPEYRTVALRCEKGHLVVLGPGPANAVRSG